MALALYVIIHLCRDTYISEILGEAFKMFMNCKTQPLIFMGSIPILWNIDISIFICMKGAAKQSRWIEFE